MTNEARRLHFGSGLSTLYAQIYADLCLALPPEWAPYYGVRTMDEQTSLWNQGRFKPGPIVTKAQAGQSPHNYGCASDWTIFEDGQPIWMAASDPRWKAYQAACDQVGATWGGTFSAVDCPHNELAITCSWSHVAVAFSQGGFRAALEHIDANRAHK